jgi:asparagine synthase (glutamine-hydrolysing)
MCGIVGYWDDTGRGPSAECVGTMAETLAHRGPDDAGTWVDQEKGLALAHRRLSIIDLSAAGHQPMVSPNGRYVLSYNGEIYNHRELRGELEALGAAPSWRGHSDTETLLAALTHWGVEATLKRLNGMFTFAFYDQSEGQLYLARDRLGEKPLYYGRNGSAFLFGSELKALTAYPGWRGEVDRAALSLFLRHNYVPWPWSIYRGIRKLPPAHFVVARSGGTEVGEPVCYWDLGAIAESGVALARRAPAVGELADELDALLSDAVARRMEADVPLGAFLSGGYDSTMVTALMQAQSARPVRTFTIGFHEETHNEAEHAMAVARHLGTDHTELYVTPEEAMAVIPRLPEIWDEPFSDSSQIPTVLVSQLARQKVTVSLSGDGGDELFCGYNRYALGHHVWSRMRWMPGPARRVSAWAMMQGSRSRYLDALMSRLPRRLRIMALRDRLPKLAEVIGVHSGDDFYRRLISHWKTPDAVVRDAREPSTLTSSPEDWPKLKDLRERMMYLDTMTYLPEDILTKVDRASMSVSLEARVPLLDHRVVEFAWRVPTSLKVRSGQGKWLLRQVLYRYVPRELMDRPKMGFGVPIEHWLRGPLRDWAEALLDERRLREEGFFDPSPIRKLWVEHVSGERRWHYYLWDVLMFQAWLETQ